MLLDMNGNAISPTKKDLDPQEFLSKSNSEKIAVEDQRRRGQWFSNYGPNVTNVGSLNGTLRKPLDKKAGGLSTRDSTTQILIPVTQKFSAVVEK